MLTKQRHHTRPLSLLLTLAMLLTLASAIASSTLAAAPEPNTTWTITDNSPDATDVPYGGGTFSWEKTSKTLRLSGVKHATTANRALQVPGGTKIVLNGANEIISTHDGDDKTSEGIYVDGAGGITISCTNYGKLTVAGGAATAHSCGIDGRDGNVTICGNAEVTAKGGILDETDINAPSGRFGSNGIVADKDIIINETAAVTAIGGAVASNINSHGIYSIKGSVFINDNVRIDAKGGAANASDGLLASKNITINGSARVTTTGGASEHCYGMETYGGSITIKGNAKVTASCEKANFSSCGIYASGGSLTISDNAEVAASTCAADEISNGIFVINGSVTINGNAKVTATGSTAKYSCGIETFDGNITVGGYAKVTASSDEISSASYGIHALSGNLTINGYAKVSAVGNNHGIFAKSISIAGGIVTAIGFDRAINKESSAKYTYIVPYGYTYCVNTAADPSSIPLRGDGSTTKIDSTHKYAKIVVNAPVIITSSLPDGSIGKSYTQILASYGIPPITWSIAKGKLPDGLTLSANGGIAGTPKVAGSFVFVAEATNNAGSDSKTLTILIPDAKPKTYADGNWINPFDDLFVSDWYYNDVKIACQLGLINGITDTHFAPKDNLTYIQAVKLASCMHQKYMTNKITLSNGTGSANWYDPYVSYAIENNIISAERKFNWNDNVTRASYMEIFSRALPDYALPDINAIADNAIPDVTMSHPNSTAIYKLYRAGILEGAGDSHACAPEAPIQRSQVAAILVRMMLPEQRKTFDMGKG